MAYAQKGTLSVLQGGADYGIVMGTKSNGAGWIQAKRVDGTATAYNLELQPLGGNVLIGTITDNTVDKLQVNGSILATGGNSTQWNTAYGWGNHASIGYLTAIPAEYLTQTEGDLRYLQTYTETDPIFTAWNKSTGISITASQVSDFDTEVANNTAVALNTAKVTNATHTGEVTGSGALTIANDVVTNAKLGNMVVNTIKGRITTGTGDPEDLTAAQVRTIINVADGANNYVHPTGDGNLHVPANSTTNSGKVLTAGATAGVYTWEVMTSGTTDHTALSNIGTNTHAQIDTALTRLVNTSGTNTGDQDLKLADNASAATSLNVGSQRYRVSGNNSYVDVCMQTGASTYEWTNITQHNW
jgi:hypothetical protein